MTTMSHDATSAPGAGFRKPSDHPEFFRLPPPPGRSRESRIVLDEHGRFWNEGVPMDHAGMATAFASWIRTHPDDGRFILENGYDWTYFVVRDAPFFVRGVSVEGGKTILLLFDGSEEPLDPSTLITGDGDALYVRVRDGKYEAKLLPAAQAALVDLIVEGPDGEPLVETPEGRFRIGRRRRHPGPLRPEV
jgi:uncharacterized protein